MFGSAILDIAVGLVFVYLLLSLVVTAVQELIETLIKLRAAHLALGVEKLLGRQLAKPFFESALIQGLSPNKWFGDGTRRPSYLPPRAFAATVLELIARADVSAPRTITAVKVGIGSIADADVKRSLTVLLEESQHDLRRFEENLEGWFNRQMERVGGWYKRKVQVIILAVGLAITVTIDADSLVIIRSMSSDSALRAALAAHGQAVVNQAPAKEGPRGQSQRPAAAADPGEEIRRNAAALKAQIGEIEGLGVPIGLDRWRNVSDVGAKVKAGLVGWLLTACAISLGAPFWFDLLNKVVNLRGAGRKPS